MLCLSAGFCIADMKQPFLLITGEFLVRAGLLGTGLLGLTILLKTVPLPYIRRRTQQGIYQCKGRRRNESTRNCGMDGDNVHVGRKELLL
jgi:hypothetical protein